MKKTVVIGASPNPSRYAYIASHELQKHEHEFVPIGIRTGQIAGQKILNLREEPEIEQVDTVTMYIHPRHQPEWYDYILKLSPNRLIFNPGAENEELAHLARKKGIEVVYACTLVMLNLETY